MGKQPSGRLLYVSDRAYRLLLRVYPADFRRDYGPEMTEVFRMLKFRTMTDGQKHKRTTRVGRVLRATFLDETPQYLNVLAGDMSLIGPRPPLPEDVRLHDAAWRSAFSVRPGMTGLAQVTYGLTRIDVLQARELDLRYVQSRSMALDLRLLMRTFRAIVGWENKSPG